MNQVLKKASALAALASAVGTMAACGPVGLTGPQGAALNALNNRTQVNALSRARNGKKWLVAIHMAADNNLYTAGLKDLNEIEAGLNDAGAAANDIEVIVLFDGAKQGDSAVYRMQADPAGLNSTLVSKPIDNPIAKAGSEIDSGDGKVFAAFTDWVTKTFPAQKNSISIWNHGGGAVRRGGEASTFEMFVPTQIGAMNGIQSRFADGSRNFGSDDNGGEMKMADLNPALAAAARNIGGPVDIMGFDTCLMSYLETAYQVKGLAKVLVASEELEPGDGWEYRSYVGGLAQNSGWDAAQLGKHMVDSYIKSYATGVQRGNDITLAATDVNVVTGELTAAINAFGAELTAGLPANKAAIDAARSKTQMFYNRDAADFGHFLQLYAGATRSRGAADVMNAYKKAVIANGFDRMNPNATGAVIYFPTSTMSYKQVYDNPSVLLFAETKGWGNFLKAYTRK
ncbi:MAG: hypothetical protein IV090_10365 [Candidatus Sericytochromatia bacterium]|nr:hypothetical protein [Candidatus Sericytochromatia bacterium]